MYAWRNAWVAALTTLAVKYADKIMMAMSSCLIIINSGLCTLCPVDQTQLKTKSFSREWEVSTLNAQTPYWISLV